MKEQKCCKGTLQHHFIHQLQQQSRLQLTNQSGDQQTAAPIVPSNRVKSSQTLAEAHLKASHASTIALFAISLRQLFAVAVRRWQATCGA